MFDSTEDLLRKIRLGEDTSFELKSVRFRGERVCGPRRDDLADEIAAMANTQDGVVLFGVDDRTRQVVGIPVERLDAVERYVYEVCNESITPPVAFRSARIELPDESGVLRPVLKVEVPRSLFVHKSPGGYFRRQGSSRREMTPEALARLFQQRSQTRLIRFDEQVVAGASLSDLAPDLWQRFRTERTRDAPQDLLAKLGMLRQDEQGVWRPTVSGILMATRDPRAWLPNAFVQAVAYRGTSPVPEGPREIYQLDARDITGPADEQIIEACRFVHRNMRVMASKAVGRRDIPQFDITAVFEAVVNAVAHRDYSIYESKVRIRLFSDRLEVYSPGSLPNTVTVESLPFRVATRNETLTSLLARCPIGAGLHFLETDRRALMDRRGGGVRIILERSERLSGRRPEYRLIDDAELLLTIFSARAPEEGAAEGEEA